jgi:hypothetical protein
MLNSKNSVKLLFYVLLAFVMFFKRKEILSGDKKQTFFIYTSVLIIILMSVLNDHKYVENFEEKNLTSPFNVDVVSSEESTEIVNLEENVSNIQNEHHQDNLLNTISRSVILSDVISYYSSFQYSSYIEAQALLLNLKHSNRNKIDDSLKLVPFRMDNNYGKNYYYQAHGIKLNNSLQLIGFNMNHLSDTFMREFSMFWYIKFDFIMSDYSEEGNVFNLFEMYSSNVIGNIALGIKIILRKIGNETYEHFIVNFGGRVYTFKLSAVQRNKKINFENGNHLLTLVKYRSPERNKHFFKMHIDSENILLDETEIEYNDIDYITSSRGDILLSREKFIINKQEDGSEINKVEYTSLKMSLMSFGIFKISIDNMNIIPTIFSNLEEQRTVKLSELFLNQQSTLAKTIEEKNLLTENSKCLYSEPICSACDTVDWSNIANFKNWTSNCSSTIQEYCRNYKDGRIANVSDYDIGLCDFVYKGDTVDMSGLNSNVIEKTCIDYGFQAASAEIKRGLVFDGLKSITLDTVTRNTYENSQESKPKEESSVKDPAVDISEMKSSVPMFDTVPYDLLSRPVGKMSYDELLKLIAIEKPDNTSEAPLEPEIDMVDTLKDSLPVAPTDTTQIPTKKETLDDSTYSSIMKKYEQSLKDVPETSKNNENNGIFAYIKNIFWNN